MTCRPALREKELYWDDMRSVKYSGAWSFRALYVRRRIYSLFNICNKVKLIMERCNLFSLSFSQNSRCRISDYLEN